MCHQNGDMKASSGKSSAVSGNILKDHPKMRINVVSIDYSRNSISNSISSNN